MTDKKDRSGGASKDQAALQSDIGSAFVPVEPFEIVVFGGTGDLARRNSFRRFITGFVMVKFQTIQEL